MKKHLKRTMLTCVFLALLGCFFIGNCYLPSLQAAGEVWTFADGNLNTGLNYDVLRQAMNPVMAVFNNELYLAWMENNSSTYQIRVRKYNGSTWSWVDGGGTTGINYNTAETANNPYLYVFNSNLYVIWTESYSGGWVTRVKRYDGGSTWTSIDGSVTNGLNKQNIASAGSLIPTLSSCNGYLYAAWVEQYGGYNQLRVKRYDSGTSWSFADGGGYSGLNYDTNKSAQKPKLLGLNNVLYLIWTENNASSKYQIRVKRYDGGATWTTVDGGSGLNYETGNTVDQANLVAYNNSLYTYWIENYIVRVKSYNGSTWSTADGNSGFKQSSYNYAYPEAAPKAIAYNDKLYFTWGEDISYDPWSIQTRAAKYNGSMTMIDGNDWTTGLNYNRLQYAYAPAIIEYNGIIYIAWYESNGSANQIRLKKTPLPAITTSVAVPSNGAYKAGQSLDFTVSFNNAVNVTGTPVLPITLSSGVAYAAYYTGSGTANLTFRYTVTAGNLDADGITVGASLALTGGTIRDTVNSLDADLNLNSVASTTGILVDTEGPTVSSLSPADGTVTIDANQNLIINFNENISKGTGNVTIRKLIDDSVVETINVTGTQVAVSTNSATIDPAITFDLLTNYYVLVDSTAFKDTAGNYFAGISSKVLWNFGNGDSLAPSGYSVAIDQDYINNDNKTAMSFTFTGAEVGATYNYTLSSTGGGGPLIGSGTITAANQQITGVSTFGLDEGTLTLSVTLTDASGNVGAATTDTVVKDTVKPTLVSAARTNNFQLIVTLSEDCINLDQANNGGFTVSKIGDDATTYAVTAITQGEDASHVVLTLTDMAVSGRIGVKVKYTTGGNGAIKDAAGNNMATNSTGVDVAAWDTTAPTLVSATRTDNTHLTVTLSEDCINITKANNGGFTVNQTGNALATYAVSAIDQGVDARHVILTVANMSASASAGVKVRYTAGTNGTIADSSGNAMATSVPALTVAAWDTAAPTLVSAVRINNTSIAVTLNEDCINLVKANNGGFTVEETGNPALTYAVSVTAGGSDASHVVLTVATLKKSGKEGVTVKYSAGGNGAIADVAGNAMESNSAGVNVGPWDTTAPTINSSTLDASNGFIDITFSEGAFGDDTGTTGLGGGLTAGDLAITFAANGGTATNAIISSVKKNNSTVEGSASALTGNEKVIRVFLTITGTPSGVETIEIKPANSSAIYDAAGNASADSITTDAKALNDKLAPTLVSATRTNNAHIEVLLSEDCINLTKTGTGGFTVNQIGSSTITYAVTAINPGTDNSHVVLTVTNMAVSGREGVKVRYTAGTEGTIQDEKGNAMATRSSALTVVAWDTAAPTITSGTLAPSNGYIDIVFSEGVYGASTGTMALTTAKLALTFAANGGTATNVAISSVKKNNNTVEASASALTGGETVIRVFLAVTGTPSGVETIEVKPVNDTSIYDKAGNGVAASETSGAKVLNDKLAPKLVSAVHQDDTHLVVELSEDCININKANNGGFTVNQTGNASVTYAVSAIDQGVDARHVILTVANMSASASAGVRVRYTAGTNGTIADSSGNAMATSTTPLTVQAWEGIF